MKIGFLGNTNNYPLRLARAIQSLGHEVVFFVDRPRSEPRHRPEFHYRDIPYPYPSWIRETEPLRPIQLALPMGQRNRLLRELKTCDGVVLNGAALSLATRLACPAVGLLTGADLDIYANPAHVDAMAATSRVVRSYAIARPFVRRLYSRFVALQRDGIANCRLVEYALPGLLPHADAILEDIGVSPRRRVCFMLTESRSPASAERPRDGRFRIFSATRLQWRPPSGNLNLSPLDNKGTDTMLEGLRRFVASAPGRPVEIHLLRVGVDADAAVQHIERLGLAPFVRWHAELPQAEFLDEMARADVVLENFNAGSALGMAARDALALGKPVVAWGNSALFAKALGEPLPIFEALTSDQICSRLIEIVSDPGAVAANADCARAYVAKWFSPRSAAEQCLAVFSGRG